MTPPTQYCFTRYLAAKKALDDRSLNRHVWDCLFTAVGRAPKTAPLRVLEVGCGIGTMIERLWDWGLLRRARYTALDARTENLWAARARLKEFAAARGAGLREEPGGLTLKDPTRRVDIELQAVELFDFLQDRPPAAWDLLVAHAFLDLVDLSRALPPLLSLLPPGGLFYFTLNFDGATVFEPVLDPDLDRQIEALYHRTMDRRLAGGRPAGDSRTGRRLFGELAAAGARVAAAGSSDWVVFPRPGGYPSDEAYFLHYIIDTVRQALEGHPELDASRFADWTMRRHGQIEAGELVYLAHQLDFFGHV